MSVGELIAILQQYDEHARVETYDEANGIIDITDVFKRQDYNGVVIS